MTILMKRQKVTGVFKKHKIWKQAILFQYNILPFHLLKLTFYWIISCIILRCL